MPIHYFTTTDQEENLRSWQKFRKYQFAALLLLLLCMFASATICIYISAYSPSESETSYDLLNSIEFQISLISVIAPSREEQIQEWLGYLEEESFYFSVSDTKNTSIIREQFHLNMTGSENCYSSHDVRVRTEDEKITIDIKGNIDNKEDATALHFEPSEKFSAKFRSKLETDVHQCYKKYSKETKVYLTEMYTIHKCRDVVEIFPDAFPELPTTALDNLVSFKPYQYWFIQEYEGKLNGDTKYKVTFSYKYETEEDAISGDNLVNSEFSIRLYSLDKGLDDHYDIAVVHDIDKAWHTLIRKYTPEECE